MTENAFISSTVEDLKEYRKAAKEAVIDSGLFPEMQEYFAAQSKYPPLEECLRKVDGCDVLVVIVAHRHGWTPPHQPEDDGKPGMKSITRLECEHALKKGKEVLAFIVDDKFDWPPNLKESYRVTEAIESGDLKSEFVTEVQRNIASLDEFKKWLSGLGTRRVFTNTESLEKIISQALSGWKLRKQSNDDQAKDSPSTAPKKMETTIELSSPIAYLNWIKEVCSAMDVEKLAGKGRAIRVELPEIFIPLLAANPDAKNKIESNFDINNQMEKHQVFDQTIDIERLVDRETYLLIEGQAGSGKTTLLKHYAHTLAVRALEGGEKAAIPVLVFLRDLKPYLEKQTGPINIHHLLDAYFSVHEEVTEFTTLCDFCRAKRAVFLVDGLDEVPENRRKALVGSFADFRAKYGIKMVMSGRQHGMEGEAMARFGDKHVQVLPFNGEQIKDFIRKWFIHIYGEGKVLGKKTAAEMIGEIAAHGTLQQMVDNPLMLTAICILYYDGRRLPEQRAELYKKFVDNMLFRRFDKPEKIFDFLKLLAYEMHTSGVKFAGRDTAVKVLKKVFPALKEEGRMEYRSRIQKLFDEIEPTCGLLKLDKGQYGFWHLSFQEYLTAVYIVDNSTQFDEAIAPFWDDEKFSEVIKLYIGYLSLEHKQWATKIIRQVVEDSGTAFPRLFLAGESLADIQEDRREEELVEIVRTRFWKEIKSSQEPKILSAMGELIGWLGDDRDLKKVVRIPGGVYDLEGLGKHEIKSFEICKYPVTNDWYAKFVDAGGYKNPDNWSEEGWKWRVKKDIRSPRLWTERKWRCPNAPVVGVSFWEAEAFCEWEGVRLPTEEEWQAAAAGSGKREYPWGNGIDRMCCNYSRNIGKTSPVGIFSKGNTAECVSDMAGNVWEWTNSRYSSSGSGRVLRGGSWDFDSRLCRAAYRGRNVPGSRFDYLGFRCASPRGHQEQAP